jgi:phosphoribosylformylglycinamidine synthase
VTATLAAPWRRSPVLLGRPRALLLRGPGTNCDRETALACELAGATPELVHVEALLAGATRLDDYGLLVLPGGFSYGDHLGAGTLLAHRLGRLGDELRRFVASGRPLLGICNGFQALLKLGLLGGGTLAPNASGRFECRWVWLANQARPDHVFLRGVERLALPVAHGEGRFVPASAAELERLAAERRIALVYADAQGGTASYPANPNGSAGGVAGLTNAGGNVLGLMPHPERNVQPGDAPAGRPVGAGLAIFRNAVEYLQR